MVNDSVGNCTGNRSLARNQKPVRSTSWLHRSIPSRPITKTFSTRPWPDSYGVETKVLVQAVKRNLARFPEDFMFHLAELGAIGRNLNQIARAINQGGRPPLPGHSEVATMLKVAEVLRDHFKALLIANQRSWTD